MTEGEIFWMGVGFLCGAVPCSFLWWLTYREMKREMELWRFWP